MPEQNELIAYAMDFTSYLISKTKNIDQVILHGSIARGDFDDNSVLDVFVNTKDKKLPEKIRALVLLFQKTSKFKEWKLKGIENPLSIIVGNFDSNEWKDLKRAIANTGITLYGKYKTDVEKTKQYVLFSFENIKPDKKRIAVFRKLFGFKLNKKTYPGITKKLNALRINKGTLLVPLEHSNELKQFLQRNKVTVRLFDLFSDEDFTKS